MLELRTLIDIEGIGMIPGHADSIFRLAIPNFKLLLSVKGIAIAGDMLQDTIKKRIDIKLNIAKF